MQTPDEKADARAAQGGTRWQTLTNWLALLMLLAGSVVWPH
jgi:hypothetical protein